MKNGRQFVKLTMNYVITHATLFYSLCFLSRKYVVVEVVQATDAILRKT